MRAAFNFKAIAQPNAVRAAVSQCIEEARSSLKSVGSCEALDSVLTKFLNSAMPVQFLRLVSTDKEVRQAATEAQSMIERFELEVFSNRSLYALVKGSSEAEGGSSERERARELYLRDFELSGGAHLEPPVQQQLNALKQEIVELQSTFSKNIADDATYELFTREELEGLDESFVSSLEREGERFKVTLQYPHVRPVLRLATRADTRQRMWIASGKKAVAANEAVLPAIVAKRLEVANLLGLPSNAVLELSRGQRMAGNTPKEVEHILEDIRLKIERKLEAELGLLRAAAQPETTLNVWDVSFYSDAVMKEHYAIDHEKIKEYFPAPVVLSGVLDCYAQLLGVRFERDAEAEQMAWQEEVQCYQVLDAASGTPLSRFYLDLHPRPGKYTHAACWWLGKKGQAEHSISTVCMVCNFTRPTADRPALFRFSEVETFFHEFGHVMHACLSNNAYQRLNWTWKAVEMDFLEVPSMCFQKFVHDAAVLQRLSAHYVTQEPLPEELRQSLIRARNADEGRAWTRLVDFATFDFLLHSAQIPPAAEWATFRANLTRKHFGYHIPAELEPKSWASFDHMVTGYNSGYYSYLWSEVVAADLFSEFKANGNLLDPALGLKLRRTVLEPCARHSGHQMCRDFLGRNVTLDSFLAAVYEGEPT